MIPDGAEGENPFNYIERFYGVSAKVGARVIYSGGKSSKEGPIVGCSGAYFMVKLDGEPHTGKYHPTWELQLSPTFQC